MLNNVACEDFPIASCHMSKDALFAITLHCKSVKVNYSLGGLLLAPFDFLNDL